MFQELNLVSSTAPSLLKRPFNIYLAVPTESRHTFFTWLTHLSRNVGLGAGVRVEPRDGQLGVGERGAAAPQLLLGARVQLETILQHRKFLNEQE